MIQKRIFFTSIASLIFILAVISCSDVYTNMLSRVAKTGSSLYSVSFKLNDGTENFWQTPVQVKIGEDLPDLSSLPKPVNRSNFFVGFFDDSAPSGGTQYYSKDLKSTKSWDKLSDGVLYAHWSANPVYTITFHNNPGSGGEDLTEIQDIPEGDESPLRANTFIQAGFRFTGWTVNKDGTGTSYSDGQKYTMGSADVNLYAQWEVGDSYTIKYYASAAFVGSKTFTALPVTLDSLPTDPGYTFEGWYDNAGFAGTKVTEIPADAKLENKNFYAKKTANTYTVEFDKNTGEGSLSDQTFTFGVSGKLTKNDGSISKTGYTFTGWNTAVGGTGTAYDDNSDYLTPAENVTLYAQWKESFTVTFNANGGAGTMDAQVFAKDTPQNLTANAFTRSGYDFADWNTKTDGSGKAYADKAEYVGTASTTLYAVWAKTYVDADYGADDEVKSFDIYTQKQLEWVAKISATKDFNHKTINLKNDIDFKGESFAGIVTGDSGAVFFNGTFNGNGHEVRNMLISGGKDVGFIGRMQPDASGGIIENFGIGDGCVIEGTENVGGIVGNFSGGQIRNCYVSAKQIGKDGAINVGGIVGLMSGGSIANVYNITTVKGQTSSTGALVGTMKTGSLNNSVYVETLKAADGSPLKNIGSKDVGTAVLGGGSGTATNFADASSLTGYGKLFDSWSFFNEWNPDAPWRMETAAPIINGVKSRPVLIKK